MRAQLPEPWSLSSITWGPQDRTLENLVPDLIFCCLKAGPVVLPVLHVHAAPAGVRNRAPLTSKKILKQKWGKHQESPGGRTLLACTELSTTSGTIRDGIRQSWREHDTGH